MGPAITGPWPADQVLDTLDEASFRGETRGRPAALIPRSLRRSLMSDDPAPPPCGDAARNLLFGLLALQNNFLSRDALVAAFGTWIADKSRPLDRILLDQGQLDADCHALLTGLVRQHLKLHGDDPAQSLADLGAVDAARGRLLDLGDPDLTTSLAQVAAIRPNGPPLDPEVTATFLGAPTSPGGRFRVLRLHAE